MWGCNVDTPEGYRVCQLVGAGRKFPLLCVVVLRDNRMTIVGRLEGYCSPQVLLNRLTHVFNDNEHHLNRARQDRYDLYKFERLKSLYNINMYITG